MGGIKGFFKSLKKKVTLKGVIGAVAKVGSVIPVVGGVLSAAAGAAAAGTQQAQQAQQQAEQQVQQAYQTGTFTAESPPGGQPLIQQSGIVLDAKTAMIAGGALLALFLIARRR